MSTCFRFTDDISEADFREAMNAVGISEEVTDETKKNKFCITNGENYVWVYVGNYKVEFEAFGGQAVSGGAMLDLIADELNTSCLCEHDEGYFPDDICGED